MFISEMFRERSCFFSIEAFPPQNEGTVQPALYPARKAMSALRQDRVSVICGADGQPTARIAVHIKNERGIGAATGQIRDLLPECA